MINQYTPGQPSLVLESDLAAEFPLYLYWPHDQSTLFYSTSIIELLDYARVPKPLVISTEGLSFLLQNGVVPPPKTAYQDIYILGIGDKAKVTTINGKIDIQFSHEFPFINAKRLQADEMQPDEDLILQMLAEATISRIDECKPSFLFHSAGKDSNSIALALAEAGWQDKVTLITHKSKGKADESEISAKIAKQLGFKHRILIEVDQLHKKHKQAINDYFSNAPFPCADNVAMAYPLYVHQLPELRDSNIIDGGGNDCYMMTPLTARETKIFPIAKRMHRISLPREYLSSENLLLPITRTSAEWCGMSGFSFYDSKSIFLDAINTYPFWRREMEITKKWDVVDFKTKILTSIVASEMHIRKARNFADSIKSKIILPFSNQRLASYFAKMPEPYLFNRATRKNKLVLRNILSGRINLDSDGIGKMGWTYDANTLVTSNLDLMVKEIEACNLWSASGLEKKLRNYLIQSMHINRTGFISKNLIYRLYLLSGWYNSNRYL